MQGASNQEQGNDACRSSARTTGMLALPCDIGSMSSSKQQIQQECICLLKVCKGLQGTLSMAPPGGSSLSQR